VVLVIEFSFGAFCSVSGGSTVLQKEIGAIPTEQPLLTFLLSPKEPDVKGGNKNATFAKIQV
jgi:hypothetical protein